MYIHRASVDVLASMEFIRRAVQKTFLLSGYVRLRGGGFSAKIIYDFFNER